MGEISTQRPLDLKHVCMCTCFCFFVFPFLYMTRPPTPHIIYILGHPFQNVESSLEVSSVGCYSKSKSKGHNNPFHNVSCYVTNLLHRVFEFLKFLEFLLQSYPFVFGVRAQPLNLFENSNHRTNLGVFGAIAMEMLIVVKTL